MSENDRMVKMSENREVDLGNIAWKLLEQWKLIVLVAITFGILAAGYKYRADLKNTQLNVPESLTLEEMRAELSNEERHALENAEKISRELEQKEEYSKNSALMNIDPYNEQSITLQYFVETSEEEQEDTDMIIEAYRSYVEQEGFIDSMAEQIQWDYDKKYLSELIGANSQKERYHSIFTVTMIKPEDLESEKLISALEGALADYQKIVQENLFEHSMTMLSCVESVQIDQEVVNLQTNLETSIISLKSQLDQLKNSFSENQMQIFSGEEVSIEKASTIRAAFSKKYFVIGIAAGMFLYVFVLGVYCFFNSKVKSSEEVERLLSIRSLGEIRNGSWKEFRGKLIRDFFVYKLHYRDKLDKKSQIEFIYYKIIGLCRNRKLEELGFALSCELNDKEMECLHEIIFKAEAAGVHIRIVNPLLAEEKEKFMEIPNVVLVLGQGKTKYRTTDKVIEWCSILNVNVIGSIWLDL